MSRYRAKENQLSGIGYLGVISQTYSLFMALILINLPASSVIAVYEDTLASALVLTYLFTY